MAGTAMLRNKPAVARLSGVFFQPPKPVVEKPKREKKPKVKNDPRHVAAARELRDRYLEQFNGGLVLANAKYEVGRLLSSEDRELRIENGAPSSILDLPSSSSAQAA